METTNQGAVNRILKYAPNNVGARGPLNQPLAKREKYIKITKNTKK